MQALKVTGNKAALTPRGLYDFLLTFPISLSLSHIGFGFTLPSVVVIQMLMFNMREDYCHEGGLENWL